MDKEIWYIYTMDYCSAIKKNDIMKFVGKLMKLENTILIEISHSRHTETNSVCIGSCVYISC